tara:strand:+ start:5744 stop:6289 length:546 start_codon:yes stop_codon:yes gene_type:complete
MNIIQQLEKEQMKTNVPHFKSGDTVVVNVKIKEGTRERIQAYEGVVIARRNRALGSSFVVRKISHGVGVERTFQLHSPLIDSIEVKRHGEVRQGKIYYIRELTGRAARIKEEIGRKKFDEAEEAVEEILEGETPAETVANVEAADALSEDLVAVANAEEAAKSAAKKEVEANEKADKDAAK